MKKTMLMAMAAMLGGVASADPGFLFKTFTGSAYNGTGDIWSSKTVTSSAEWAYSEGDAYGRNNNTTYGYACYMYFTGGVTYKFRAFWDDYSTVKVDDSMVVPLAAEICSAQYGEIRFEDSGWHKLELRVSNVSGYYGRDPHNSYEFVGIHYSTDDGRTWNSFNSSRGNYFYTVIPESYSITYVFDSSIRASDPTILDTTYVVHSKKPKVKVRVLAFEDGERSFAKVVRPETFVTDTNGVETACNVGDNVTPNVEHTISWRVSSDWKTKLAKVKFEVLVCEGELLPLELMTIPASDQYGKMKISWNAISESQWFDALLWLYADKTEGLMLTNGALKNGAAILAKDVSIKTVGKNANSYYDYNGSAWWTDTVYPEQWQSAPEYVFSKMGFSTLSGANLTYANSETRLGLSPSGARQYAYKIVEE